MKKELHKSIPQILIESLEKDARETRQEIQQLKDYLRKHPDREFMVRFITLTKQQLTFYDEQIKEMRYFYGREGFLP